MAQADRSVSVIVASRGRPQDLAKCVDSILASSFDRFELIVVEQLEAGCPAAELATDPRLIHRVSPTVGKTVALNEALRIAAGDVLFFTDDDCTVPADWIASGLETLREHPDVGAVFGPLEPGVYDWSTHFMPAFRPQSQVVLRGPRGFMFNGGVAGANLIVTRSALSGAGAFDEEFGPGRKFRGSEEFDLLYRLLHQGHAVVLSPTNGVIHHGARSYRDGSATRLLRGYRFAEGAVLAKHFRCGDWMALGMVGMVLARDSSMCACAIIKERRPRGAGPLGYFVAGFWSGLLHRPLDRDRRLFVPA